MATISNGESGSSVRTKLNEIINKVEGVTSINNNIDVTGTITSDGLTVEDAGTIQLTKNTSAYQDSLGIVEFHDEDGNASADAGKFQLQAFRGGDKDAPDFKLIGSDSTGVLRDRIQVEGSGDISFYEHTGTTPKFFWDASAEALGIGTSSPAVRLQVTGEAIIGPANPDPNNAQGSQLFVVGPNVNSSTAQINLGAGGASAGTTSSPYNLNLSFRGYLGAERARISSWDITGSSLAGVLRFWTNDTSNNFAERMRIDSSGNLLVGTTSGTGRIQVTAAASQNGVNITVPTFDYFGSVIHNQGTSGDNTFIGFGTEAAFTFRGSISYNRAGGLVAYNTTSDYRAKDIAGPIEDASSTVLSLKPYMGTMKGATAERPMFVAHETQEVAPYAVTGEKDAVDQDGNPKYQQMDHSALVPLLTAALQEALTEIADLKARVAALEA